MGLFSSSKSSSTTTTTQNTETNTQGIDASSGVGNVYTGDENVYYTNTFGEEAANTLQQALDSVFGLASKTLDLNKYAIGEISQTGQNAVSAVSQRFEASENPNLSAFRDIIPLLMVATIAGAAFFILRGKI